MFLIDGYNLLMAGGRPRGSFEAAREKLVERVARHLAGLEAKGEIFFDSSGEERGIPRSAQLTVRTVPDADAAIIGRIRAERDRTALIVVTSDRAIVDEARAKRIRVVASDAFAEELARAPAGPGTPDPKARGISKAEADAWMEEFGL
jgi:predicted RNA-binding protein with PIN domain